jgi:hypothetical protein
MPLTLAADDIIEFRHEGYVVNVGTPWNIVHHWRVDEVGEWESDFAALTDLAQIMHEHFETAFAALLSHEWNMIITRAKRVSPVDSVFAIYADAVVGGDSANIDEPDDALVITKRTDKAGRRGLGRMYLPGVPDDDVENGLNTNVGAYANAAGTFFPLFLASGAWNIEPVVFSRKSQEEALPDSETWALIERVEVDGVMRRQTRRELPIRVPVLPSEPE